VAFGYGVGKIIVVCLVFLYLLTYLLVDTSRCPMAMNDASVLVLTGPKFTNIVEVS